MYNEGEGVNSAVIEHGSTGCLICNYGVIKVYNDI